MIWCGRVVFHQRIALNEVGHLQEAARSHGNAHIQLVIVNMITVCKAGHLDKPFLRNPISRDISLRNPISRDISNPFL
jgi:hypothetical protein